MTEQQDDVALQNQLMQVCKQFKLFGVSDAQIMNALLIVQASFISVAAPNAATAHNLVEITIRGLRAMVEEFHDDPPGSRLQ